MKESSSWEEQESNFPPPSHPVFQGIRDQEERNGFYRPTSFNSRSVNERRFSGSNRPSRWDGSWGNYRGSKEEEEFDDRETSRIFAQIVGAAVLVAAVYVTFHSSFPFAQKAQQIVKNTMTHDSDFSTVTTWIQTHVGGDLAIPTLSSTPTVGSGSDTKSSIDDQTFVDPLADYKITQEFDAVKHPALTLQTKPSEDVKTVTKGEVKTVDKNDKYGIYVIVDHGGSLGQTLYGHLESTAVKPGDWLYTGQTLGKVTGKEGADLYLAYMKTDKQFSNPRDLLNRVER